MKYRTRDQYCTAALFREMLDPTAGDLLDTVVFTLKEHDDVENGWYSFQRLYVEIGDPTEYKQAKELVGGVNHWQVLLRCKWFKEMLKEARTELKQKLRSDAYARIAKSADEAASDAVRLTAQRFIIKEGCKLMLDDDDNVKMNAKRGRPSAEEIKGELVRMSAEEKQLLDDYKRVTQVVN
jgi:hypothetical protein